MPVTFNFSKYFQIYITPVHKPINAFKEPDMSAKAIHTKAALHETTDKHVTQWPQTADEVLASAANIIAERYVKKDAYTNPQATKDYFCH